MLKEAPEAQPAVSAPPKLRRGSLPDRLRRDPLHTVVTIMIDLIAATASVVLAQLVHVYYVGNTASRMTWLFIPLVVIVLGAASMYRRSLRRNFLDEIGPVATAVAIAVLVLLSLMLLENEVGRPGQILIPLWIGATVLIPMARLGRVWMQRQMRTRYGAASPTLVLGDGLFAHQMIARMFEMPEYGLRPVGILGGVTGDYVGAGPPGLYPDVPHVGSFGDFAEVAAALEIEDLIVPQCAVPDAQLVPIVRQAHTLGVRVWVLPRLHDAFSGRARIDHIGGLPLIVLPQFNPRSWQFAVKHVLDRALTGIGLLVISPVFLLLTLLVRLSSPGPIFFKQKRVGRDGKPFDCLKFRSMRPPRESDAAFELTAGAAPGGVEGVDRRTRVGKVMRATSLDELPQLINVLRGDMSLVGPRPERPEFVELFEMQIRRYGERHRVKAGVTGWAQVHGLRGQTSIADRAEWDNYYIENWSIWLDVKILALTVLAVLKRAE